MTLGEGITCTTLRPVVHLQAYVLALVLVHGSAGCGKSSKSPPAQKPDAAVVTPRPGPPKVLWQRDSKFGKVFVVRQGSLRYLRFGKASNEDQSAFDPKRPFYEPLEYVRMALLGFAYTRKPRRVLMVGLGGGSFLRHARRWAPGAIFDAVEINPVVVTACRKWFGFAKAGKVNVHVVDGRRFVQRQLQTKIRYDLVFLDAYDAVDYPKHLGTVEFFTEVRRLLSPGGVAVANLSPNTLDMRNALVKTFAHVLKATTCLYSPTAGNTVVVGGPGVARVEPAALASRIKVLHRSTGRSYQLLQHARELCPFNSDSAPLLGDPGPEPRPATPPKKK